MVRVSSPAKLRPWSELTAKMVMGVAPGLVNRGQKSRQTFFLYKVFRQPFGSWTHQKVCVSYGPGDGEKLFDP